MKKRQPLPRQAPDLAVPLCRGETARQFVQRHIAMGHAGAHRRHRWANLTPPRSGETAKQFVMRHILKGNCGPQRWHRRLTRVLEGCGFVVKTVQRKDYHPIWNLSLRAGTVKDAWDYRAVRRHVSKALRELGLKCPPSEVGAVITGKVLQVSFGWDAGSPGILTFWPFGKGQNQETRMCWLPKAAQLGEADLEALIGGEF